MLTVKKITPAEPEEVIKKESTTNSDCGLFVKGEHERCFAYSAQTVLHDGQMFHELYKKMDLCKTQIVAVDAGYKTPSVVREIFKSGKIPAVLYTRPMTKDGFFRESEYVYDEFFDYYLCPQNQILKYTTTNREGYREYKSDPRVCENCPCRENCTLSKNKTKVVVRHVWAKYMEDAEHLRYVPKVRDTYKKRKETIERVFAEANERHCLRYTNYRDLAKIKMQVALIFFCLNLKKLAKRKRKIVRIGSVKQIG